MMNRGNLVFACLLAVLVLFSRAVFSQAPGPMAPMPEPPAPITSPMDAAPPGSTEGAGGSASGQSPQGITITDEVDPNSPNPWDRVRDVFRPFGGGPRVKVVEVAAPTIQEAGPEIPTEEEKRRMPALQGILISSDDDKVAILDDQFTRPGDFCAGYQVKKIHKNSVVLKRDGKEFVLYVKQ